MRGQRKRTVFQMWSRAHGNKELFTDSDVAQVACDNLNTLYPNGLPFVVYDCTWSDDFKSKTPAPVHYHVGRVSSSAKS